MFKNPEERRVSRKGVPRALILSRPPLLRLQNRSLPPSDAVQSRERFHSLLYTGFRCSAAQKQNQPRRTVLAVPFSGSPSARSSADSELRENRSQSRAPSPKRAVQQASQCARRKHFTDESMSESARSNPKEKARQKRAAKEDRQIRQTENDFGTKPLRNTFKNTLSKSRRLQLLYRSVFPKESFTLKS